MLPASDEAANFAPEIVQKGSVFLVVLIFLQGKSSNPIFILLCDRLHDTQMKKALSSEICVLGLRQTLEPLAQFFEALQSKFQWLEGMEC